MDEKNCHHNCGNSGEDDSEEAAHFAKIASTFLAYKRHALEHLKRKTKMVSQLPARQRELIPRLSEHIRRVAEAVDVNYAFLKNVINDSEQIFENRSQQNEETSGKFSDAKNGENSLKEITEFNMEKLHSTLRQIVRDWTHEGENERRQCYEPILEKLRELFPTESERSKVKILVPGAGLGRLAFEIAKNGFECQGNEFSLFMLFVSNFILNYCKTVDMCTIHPWIHQWTNQRTYDQQLRSVNFPDVNPADVLLEGNFSMAAGDFLDVYGTPDSTEHWHCVTTVFFMDTARNILAYLETIYRILKPGGYWLNFGPLLYHFADMPGEFSIELPYEELVAVSLRLGFELTFQEMDVPAHYTQNTCGMLMYEYKCAFSIFRKPERDGR